MALKEQQIIGGHYEIIKSLGKGGFGETYLAKNSQAMNNVCVVKQFTFVAENPEMLQKAIDLFEREAKVLYDLTNTNPPPTVPIPRFMAHFQEDGQFYLVQEYIKGTTLRKELQKKGTLTEKEVTNLLENVLEILQFLHKQDSPIIHRDIKPDNIIRRSEDNKFVLIDFGSVKIRQEITHLTSAKTYISTPGYSPPEQLWGDAQANSDIYSLGITALESLTGLPISYFNNLDFIDVEELLEENNISVGETLQRILQKMVEPDGEDRYQSVNAVLYDLRIYLHSQQSQSPPNLNPPTILEPDSELLLKNNQLKNRVILPSLLSSLLLGLMVIITGGIATVLVINKLSNNNPISQPTPTTTPEDNSQNPPIRIIPVEPKNKDNKEPVKPQKNAPIKIIPVSPNLNN